jgi:hypothetical protein
MIDSSAQPTDPAKAPPDPKAMVDLVWNPHLKPYLQPIVKPNNILL